MRLAKEILNQVPLVQPAVTPKEASVELGARGLNRRELELGPFKSQVNNCQVAKCKRGTMIQWDSISCNGINVQRC